VENFTPVVQLNDGLDGYVMLYVGFVGKSRQNARVE
jgi:hypothetical protein